MCVVGAASQLFVSSGFLSVAGREAAGRRPAGVDQQGVSDRGDVRGGQERPDSDQIQVATQTVALCGLLLRSMTKHTILGIDASCIQSKMTLLP